MLDLLKYTIHNSISYMYYIARILTYTMNLILFYIQYGAIVIPIAITRLLLLLRLLLL